MLDLAFSAVHAASGFLDAASTAVKAAVETSPALHAASVVVKAAVDTSFANDPAVKFVTRIAGIIFLVVLIIRGLNIYADKNKRGELIGEVMAGIVCIGFILFPEVVMTILATLWGFVAGWITGQA